MEIHAGGAAGTPEHTYRIAEWKVMVFGFVLAIMVFCLISIRYTLWGVVSTLAMIEEPEYSERLRIEKNPKSAVGDTAAQPLMEQDAEAEITMVKNKPVTTTIRSTVRHLQERAGYLSRWRGLKAAIIYAIAHSVMMAVLIIPLSLITFRIPMLASSLASIASSIVLARLSTAWVHSVIAEPSAKTWWQRIPPSSTWKHLWAPTAMVDAVTRLAFVLPTVCAAILRLDRESDIGLTLVKLGICGALGLLTLVALVIPSIVVLVRIQASLLPEDDNTIVPFDRTFGGKVVPAILGGSGTIGFLDAWRSFGMAARFRIVKLYIKFIAIEVAMHIWAALILIGLAISMIGSGNVRKIVQDRRMPGTAEL